MPSLKKSLSALAFTLLALASFTFAQTTVLLSPVPQFQHFLQNGSPNAFGCVFSFRSGTVTPLATYTDYTGNIQNSNPVILSAGGTANIWIAAGQAYTIVVKASGGSNCATGTTQYSVDGIGGGGSQLTTIVTPVAGSATFSVQAQNQLFTLTLIANTTGQPLSVVGVAPPTFITFQITQDAVGNHTFSWPANTIGGASIGLSPNQVTTQTFIWNGTNAIAIGPAVEGAGPMIAVGSIVGPNSIPISPSITSPFYISASANPATAGVLRMANLDLITWRDFTGTSNWGISPTGTALDGMNLTAPGGIVVTAGFIRLFGTTNASPMLKRNGASINLRLADDSADAPISASLGVFSAHIAVDGLTITGSGCTAGQVLTASSPTAAACAALPIGITKDFSQTGCTTGTSTDSTCTGTITISPAFADASYIPQLTINSINGAFVAVSVSGSLLAGSIPYTITCTFNCGTIVAPTIYVHAFHP